MNTGLNVRSFWEEDLSGIVALLRGHIHREPDADLLHAWCATFPSAVLVKGPEVYGFACSTRFAPDILELTNILIASNIRNKGWGELLLAHLEKEARLNYQGIILANSAKYEGIENKRPATAFYTRLGYRVITSTTSTNVLYKAL